MIIEMEPVAEHRRRYGITHQSTLAYRAGEGRFHNRHHPHRVEAWSNVDRPNPRNGQPVRFGDFGAIDGGDGEFLDPHRRATDAPESFFLRAECLVISDPPAPQPTYADEPLDIGTFVTLRFPDGRLVPAQIVARSLADPELIPVRAAPGRGTPVKWALSYAT